MKVKGCSCGNCASVCWGQDSTCKWNEIKWSVRCAECGKDTGFYDTKTEAIKRWNELKEVHKDA